MDEVTAKLIEELATKLGTTTEHLWGVMLRQAPIESGCTIAVTCAVAVGLSWLWKRLLARKPLTYPHIYDDVDREFGRIMLGIITLLFVGGTMCVFNDVVSGFVNPEYWALKQLLP